MFAYYRSQVLLAYQEKKAANALSLNLTYPTPSKLKAECMAVLNERYRLKDEKILRALLGAHKDATAYMHAFKKLDADKLRPLDNFLKQKTDDTDEKNVELLAWLIDFEIRPYQIGWGNNNLPLKTILDQKDDVVNNENSVKKEIKQPKQNTPSWFSAFILYIQTDSKRLRRDIILLLAIMGLVITCLIYIGIRMHLSANEGCMYWTGNNYQAVSCSKKMKDTLIIALDTFRLNHFKRLNNPDTITEKAIGHVWYIKTNNKMEFFTGSGFYPADPKRNVKPITVYMIDKYILHK